jgi:hypothetical protein
MSNSYEVGYKKPPKDGRFRKGVSGNRKGRPKGKRNFATLLKQTLEETITVSEGRVRKTVTKLEAALKQLVDKAASGDLVAARQLITLVRSAEQTAVEPRSKQLSDVDFKIVRRALQRLGSSADGETGDAQ